MLITAKVIIRLNFNMLVSKQIMVGLMDSTWIGVWVIVMQGIESDRAGQIVSLPGGGPSDLRRFFTSDIETDKRMAADTRPSPLEKTIRFVCVPGSVRCCGAFLFIYSLII